jgi:proline iminopeptidase
VRQKRRAALGPGGRCRGFEATRNGRRTLGPSRLWLRTPRGERERASPEAVAAAQKLFGGDMSPESLEAFGRLVFPFYAGPSHMDVPGQIMPLSEMNAAISEYFFNKLAPGYDLRPRLGEISAPTLVIVGHYDWVCSPAASRAIAHGIPGAEFLELANAGHFGFSEEPEMFITAVRRYLHRVGA